MTSNLQPAQRWTMARVIRLVENAALDAGLTVIIEDARWLGVWCKPRRAGDGAAFRCARVRVREALSGRTATKAVIVERDGAWSVR